ncbi:uncharacterized protein CLUP02_09081 [Colletotrichum lupini]|uniref:Uncharacterized protein n=1 Tax=Colletotrichum lupini TaxID=145971 RepID=A0A9Q8WI24_9PEZI|nr:uncharacterized protein CLUP02_09081 [Colletotrichum lupini]UQC83587.1 hypothetical protein CLUP02_09081 [Colletotrichum lupini]
MGSWAPWSEAGAAAATLSGGISAGAGRISSPNNYLDVVHRGRGSVSTEHLGPSFLATGNKASWTPDKGWVKIGVVRQMVTGEQKKIPRGDGSHYELSTYLPLWTLFAGNCLSFSGCISRKTQSTQSTYPIQPSPFSTSRPGFQRERGDPSRDTFSMTGLRVELNLDSAYRVLLLLPSPYYPGKQERGSEAVLAYISKIASSRFPEGIIPKETQYLTRGDEHVQWVGTARYIARIQQSGVCRPPRMLSYKVHLEGGRGEVWVSPGSYSSSSKNETSDDQHPSSPSSNLHSSR